MMAEWSISPVDKLTPLNHGNPLKYYHFFSIALIFHTGPLLRNGL